jgi:hypothetical protein
VLISNGAGTRVCCPCNLFTQVTRCCARGSETTPELPGSPSRPGLTELCYLHIFFEPGPCPRSMLTIDSGPRFSPLSYYVSSLSAWISLEFTDNYNISQIYASPGICCFLISYQTYISLAHWGLSRSSVLRSADAEHAPSSARSAIYSSPLNRCMLDVSSLHVVLLRTRPVISSTLGPPGT